MQNCGCKTCQLTDCSFDLINFQILTFYGNKSIHDINLTSGNKNLLEYLNISFRLQSTVKLFLLNYLLYKQMTPALYIISCTFSMFQLLSIFQYIVNIVEPLKTLMLEINLLLIYKIYSYRVKRKVLTTEIFLFFLYLTNGNLRSLKFNMLFTTPQLYYYNLFQVLVYYMENDSSNFNMFR